MVHAIDEVECAFLVRPAELGESHSLKDCIYGLATIGHDCYISDPYVSLASGNLVRTHPRRIEIPAAPDVVMCVDNIETVAALLPAFTIVTGVVLCRNGRKLIK